MPRAKDYRYEYKLVLVPPMFRPFYYVLRSPITTSHMIYEYLTHFYQHLIIEQASLTKNRLMNDD